MNVRPRLPTWFAIALLVPPLAALRAAVGESATVHFPSGERVVGRIVEQSSTHIVIESPVLGRVEASTAGIVISPADSPGATQPAAPAAAAVAATPKPAATAPPSPGQFEAQAFALLGGFLDAAAKSAVQPGWTDWAKGWHGLLSAGWQFENQGVERERLLAWGELAKTVKQSEVRVSALHITQRTATKEEVNHTQWKLRLRHGLGSRWVVESEDTWTSNPLIFGLEQRVYSGALNYVLWKGARGQFQFGPGYVWTDTKYDIPILPPDVIWHVRMRDSGWGGQAHLKWAPLSWLALESDASGATFRNVLPGFNLALTSVRSRVLMLVQKPWTIGLRHEYNRIALRGLVHLPLIPSFELAPYAESIVWLDFGYRF